MTEDRIIVREGENTKKKGWFSRKSSQKPAGNGKNRPVSLPPGAKSSGSRKSVETYQVNDEDLKQTQPTTPVIGSGAVGGTSPLGSPPPSSTPRPSDISEDEIEVPKHAGFDLKAIQDVIANAEPEASIVHAPVALTPRARASMPLPHEPSDRPESVPLSMDTRDQGTEPEEQRSASARPARTRIASEPYRTGMNPFEQEQEDGEEDGGDIGTALGLSPVPGPSGAGLGISSSHGLISAFSRSSLDDRPVTSTSSYPGYGSANPFSTSSVPSWRSDEPIGPAHSAWSSNGTGTSFGYSDPFATSNSRLSSEALPTLSFGGAGGTLWGSDPRVPNAMEKAMLSSPFSSPPGSASLPEDVLNPFGISYSDIGTPSKKNDDDGWQPPPLTIKSMTDNGDQKSSKQKTNLANASTFNLSSNPWG